jgi:4-amino-4-deoxy-L-arabinose transferase-like glycosyltransferase
MSDSAGQAPLPVSSGNRAREWHLPAPSLGRILELALFLRLAAAVGLEWYVRRRLPGRLCIFDDSGYYWLLAGTIRRGTLYEIMEWGDIPHFALRPPGYPVFLAACRAALGDHPLGARLVQAVLGMLTAWLVYRLSLEVIGKQELAPGHEGNLSQTWSVPLLAAALTALHPYLIVMSALLLSEALFVPLMLLALWGLAILWNGRWQMANAKWQMPDVRQGIKWRELLIAFGVGLASGAAILTRPSWALFVPVMMAAWAWRELRLPGEVHARLWAVTRVLAALALGGVVVMGPWWVRNARIYGKFVPTALWMGASLYDGLNPEATGTSNMAFLSSPDVWPLDELDQDRELTRRALVFARQEPSRVLHLAIVKLGRYWCPWPGAEGFRALLLSLASAMVMVPLLASMGLGLWQMRGNLKAWVLLAGPLLYFCLLHMVFASSMRYRIPAEAPALVLAVVGLTRLTRAQRRSGIPA